MVKGWMRVWLDWSAHQACAPSRPFSCSQDPGLMLIVPPPPRSYVTGGTQSTRAFLAFVLQTSEFLESRMFPEQASRRRRLS